MEWADKVRRLGVRTNATYYEDVRIPDTYRVGEVNGGWAVAMTLLGYERGEAAATMPIMFMAFHKGLRATPERSPKVR